MNLHSRRSLCATIVLIACLGADQLRAPDAPNAASLLMPSIGTSLPHNGDPGGIHKWLSRRGITYNLIYTNDVPSNLSGGIRTAFLVAMPRCWASVRCGTIKSHPMTHGFQARIVNPDRLLAKF